MIYTDILNEISEILTQEYPQVDVKVTPWQVAAGAGYDKIQSRPEILINLGELTYIPLDKIKTSASQYKAGKYDVGMNIMISVGKTNLNDINDFEIEDICKRIIELLHFRMVQGGLMEFATLSIGIIDENLNYWRHLRFTINYIENAVVQ